MRILLLFLFSITGCSHVAEKKMMHVRGVIGFSEYHDIECLDEKFGACIPDRVALRDLDLKELITVSGSKNKEGLKLTGVRKNEHRSQIEETTVLELVYGSYSTVNGNNWDGIEEVSLFKNVSGSWQYMETSVIYYDPF